MKIFQYCAAYLMQYKLKYFSYLFLNIGMGLLNVGAPIISGMILNTLTVEKDKNRLVVLCIVLATIITIRVLMGFLSNHLYIKLQVEAGYNLTKHVIDHIQNLSLTFFANKDSAYLSERVNADCNEVMIFSITLLINVVTNLLTLAVSLFVLFQIDILIGSILSVLILVYVFLYAVFKKKLYERDLKLKESQSHFFSDLVEQFSHIYFIKVHSAAHIFAQRLDESITHLLKNQLCSQKLQYLFSSCDSFLNLAVQVFMFLYGGFLIIDGELAIGTFTILTSYYSMMLSAARYFYNLGASYQSTLVSFRRIQDILCIPVQRDGDQCIERVCTIDIENLCFQYGDNTIFRNFNHHFEVGNIYAIVGHNGAGKSTLIKLMLGLYLNEFQGEIRYNQINIHQLQMSKLRSDNMGVTEQEPVLIPDTVLKNLCFERKYDRNKLISFIEMLGMGQYIDNLPNGLDTRINEHSSNLSGGEKQKISIIRQLLKSPRIMIFDEPSSALDKNSKEKFFGYLEKIKADKLIIIVTHDDRIREFCDETITLEL